MVAVLSSDGILRNFTADDFKAVPVGTSQVAAVLSTIAPTTVVRGAPNTTLTLTGTGFKDGAVAKSGTTKLATTFASATSLTAVLPASLLVGPGTLQITEVNPDAPATVAKPFTVS